MPTGERVRYTLSALIPRGDSREPLRKGLSSNGLANKQFQEAPSAYAPQSKYSLLK
jgi:hypothetical protein